MPWGENIFKYCDLCDSGICLFSVSSVAFLISREAVAAFRFVY